MIPIGWSPDDCSPSFRRFVKDNPECLTGLHPKIQGICRKLCDLAAARRRPHYNRFALSVVRAVHAFSKAHPRKRTIIARALKVGHFGRSLALAYLEAALYICRYDDVISFWTSQAIQWAALDEDLAEAFLALSPDGLKTFGLDGFKAWTESALEIRHAAGPEMNEALLAYFRTSINGHKAVHLESWPSLLKQADTISQTCPAAAASFLGLAPQLIQNLDENQRENWVLTGLALCRRETELVNYFGGHSFKLRQSTPSIENYVHLKEKMNTLALICKAYLGRPVQLQPNRILDKVREFSGGSATDGQTIYLPSIVPEFGMLKLMALHQAALIDLDPDSDGETALPAAMGRVHLEADRRLLDKLPRLRSLMEAFSNTVLVDGYPDVKPDDLTEPMPWWGDWLPGFSNRTKKSVKELVEKATGLSDIPAGTLEALIAGMMADGDLDVDNLWARLWMMLDIGELDSPDAEDLDEDIQTFLYPEWDTGLWDYKMDWCLVRERIPNAAPNPFAQEALIRLSGLAANIRRLFLWLKPEMHRRQRAQSSGDDLDLDAAVTAFVEAKAGLVPADNIYIRRDKRERDVAVLFLMDASRSTEEETGEKRVIDIQKEAMLVMAEALLAVGDRFAVYGFSTEGRFRVDMLKVKGFNEPWDTEAQYRLGAIKPRGLTRMGTIIRHATYRMQNLEAGTKLIMLFTDGRPYDLQYGDFNYAIEDTRKAFQEAGNQGQKYFIITSDTQGSEYLHRISPQTQTIILPDVQRLPSLLPSIYRRLTT